MFYLSESFDDTVDKLEPVKSVTSTYQCTAGHNIFIVDCENFESYETHKYAVIQYLYFVHV